MRVICVDCRNCGHLNQIPGDDLDMVDFLSGTRAECQACGKDLDFTQARIEDYQRSAGA